MELNNRSHTRSVVRRDSKGFVHMHDTDEISETMHGGSVHGSENDLVSNPNGIMVKHEYEVRIEDQGLQTLPIARPHHPY